MLTTSCGLLIESDCYGTDKVKNITVSWQYPVTKMSFIKLWSYITVHTVHIHMWYSSTYTKATNYWMEITSVAIITCKLQVQDMYTKISTRKYLKV